MEIFKRSSWQRNIKIQSKIYILVFILLLNSIVLCQAIEKGWKGIKPLQTNKATVDKLLGTPEINDNGYQNYKTDDAFVQVNYSTAPCEENQYKRGEYNIAQNTVLDYTVRLKERILLSEFNFKRDDYTKDTSGCLLSSADYRNEDNSISIGVYIQEGTEYVTDIRFRESNKNIEAFKCK